MSDAQFLDEIIANPHDDVPRLVYADWLEERGDPRGEFIRLQLELAEETLDPEQRRDLQIRQADLLDEHRVEWAGPIADLVTRLEFARGFVEFVVMEMDDFILQAEHIYRLAPVRSVLLNCWRLKYAESGDDDPSVPSALVECPHLRRLASIELTGASDYAIQRLFRLQQFPHLERLVLRSVALSDETVELIASNSSLADLTELDLSDNQLTNPSAVALAESTYITKLKTLDLSANRIRLTGARAIAASENFASLNYLDFRSNPRDRKAATVLLQRFGVWNCEV